MAEVFADVRQVRSKSISQRIRICGHRRHPRIIPSSELGVGNGGILFCLENQDVHVFGPPRAAAQTAAATGENTSARRHHIHESAHVVWPCTMNFAIQANGASPILDAQIAWRTAVTRPCVCAIVLPFATRATAMSRSLPAQPNRFSGSSANPPSNRPSSDLTSGPIVGTLQCHR